MSRTRIMVNEIIPVGEIARGLWFVDSKGNRAKYIETVNKTNMFEYCDQDGSSRVAPISKFLRNGGMFKDSPVGGSNSYIYFASMPSVSLYKYYNEYFLKYGMGGYYKALAKYGIKKPEVIKKEKPKYIINNIYEGVSVKYLGMTLGGIRKYLNYKSCTERDLMHNYYFEDEFGRIFHYGGFSMNLSDDDIGNTVHLNFKVSILYDDNDYYKGKHTMKISNIKIVKEV